LVLLASLISPLYHSPISMKLIILPLISLLFFCVSAEASYKLDGPGKRLKGVGQDTSGLAYRSETDTFFTIDDKNNHIYELNGKGEILRSYLTGGFHDPEGITHVRGNQFAIIEEARGNLCLIELNPEERMFDKELAECFSVAPSGNNLGLEAITYNSETRTFYLAKESKPMKLYSARLEYNGTLSVTEPFNAELLLGNTIKDISGLYLDPILRDLYILSEKSKKVLVMDLISRHITKIIDLTLLSESMPKPEGIALDMLRSIYIVSEPNLFYKLDKDIDSLLAILNY